ncbi:MAG: NUDIX domain-containing protein [Candidatus Electryonea clarkiae]|nr:NUDIX domain-containing protein [Candidatus Electryonea clarkiae]MDP8285243.1 NUDIX domain-containing protein [Candidatus Electryonea clarkiae]
MSSPIRAVLDIGTNSMKMVVVRYENGKFESLLDAGRITRLGEKVTTNRFLLPDSIERTLNAADELMEEVDVFQPDSIDAVGTVAMRMAENRDEITIPLYERYGLRVRLLTEAEDPNAAFFAVRTIVPEGPIATLDVGGGSADIAIGTGKAADYTVSLPLGARVLLDELPIDDPPTENQINAIREYVRTIAVDIKPLAPDYQLVLIGGGVTALAGYAKAIMGAPGERLAEELYPETMERLVRIFADCTVEGRRGLPGANPDLADILIHGGIATRELVRVLGADVAKVAAIGIGRGLLESELLGLPLDPECINVELPDTSFRPLNRKGREGEVIFLLRTKDKRIWLQTKERYPENIYRIPGGGVKFSENPRQAAIREITEETGIKNPRPMPLSKIRYSCEDGSRIDFYSLVFLQDCGDHEPVSQDPDEKISGWECVTVDQLEDHAARLENLNGKYTAWGIFRAAQIREAVKLAERHSW